MKLFFIFSTIIFLASIYFFIFLILKEDKEDDRKRGDKNE